MALDQTDRKIRKLKKQNKSLREIAVEIGLSHVAVKKRLDRMKKRQEENTTPVNFDIQGRTKVDDHPGLLMATNKIDHQLIVISGIIGKYEFSIDSGRGWTVEYKRPEG